MSNGSGTDLDYNSLQWLDWIAIIVMLVVSTAIGIYYRFSGGKQETAEEYFNADRSSGYFVLSIGMMVAFLSAISLLGSSSENYAHGIQFNLIHIGSILSTPIIAYIYLPVFYKLHGLSIFEYFEKRFGMTARLVASLANFFQTAFYTGIVIYAPSLAFEATTGINGKTSILLIGLVSTFYSTIGGMKAVIVTDLVQGVFTYICLSLVIAVGLINLDGDFFSVFEIASKGGRLEIFNFDFDPTVRHTWWSLTIGGIFQSLVIFVASQAPVQRMLTARSLHDARKALSLSTLLILIMTQLISLSGLVLYAYYSKCDPVSIGRIESYDMIMPYFAKERMTRFPGLAGVFVAGIFSASLSVSSAMLNAMAAMTLSDYVKPMYRKLGWEFQDNMAATYGKFLALTFGLFSLLVAFLASELGGLIQTVLAISGAVGGPILGLFTLGMVFESPNEVGSVIGIVIALVINLWIVYLPKPLAPNLVMSTDGCPANSSKVHLDILSSHNDDCFSYMSRISYLWYTPIGMFITMFVGYTASIIVKNVSSIPPVEPDPDLFTPMIAARIRSNRKKNKK